MGMEGVHGASAGIKQQHVVAYCKRMSFCYKCLLVSGCVGSLSRPDRLASEVC
jgi:hypothetical protein